MHVEQLDNLDLTVRDLNATCAFYTRVLGMRELHSEDGNRALTFGGQKINLYLCGQSTEPGSQQTTLGPADLCFITSEPLAHIACRLRDSGVCVEDGPVERAGTDGPILSIYFRDPDAHLIELSNHL